MAESNAKKRHAIYICGALVLGAVLIAAVGWKFFRPEENVPVDDVRRAVESRLTKQYETEYRRQYGYPKDFPVPPKGSSLPVQTASPTIATMPQNAQPSNRAKSNKSPDTSPTPNEQQKDEAAAAAKLKEARQFKSKGDSAKAKEICLEILSKYPAGKAAEEATALFNSLQ